MAADRDAHHMNFMTQLRSDFEGSSQFIELQQAFLATGRGRRKKVVNTVVDNKLLLQVFMLKEDGAKSWKDTEEFLHKVIGRDDIPCNRMRTLTEKALRKVKELLPDTLPSFLESKVDIDALGPFLSSLGFTRASLLNCDFSITDSVPTNGMMIELGRFQKKNSLPKQSLLNWFCRLTQVTADLPPEAAVRLKKSVDDVTKTYERMQMTKKSDQSRLELDSFGHTPFVIHGMFSQESQAPETSPSSAKVLPKYELGGVHSKMSGLNRQVEELKQKVQTLQEEVKVLRDERKKTSKEVETTISTNVSLTQQLVDARNSAKTLQEEIHSLRVSVSEKDAQLKTLKKENVLRRNRRLLFTIRQLQSTIVRYRQQVQNSGKQKKRLANSNFRICRKFQATEEKRRETVQGKRQLLQENRNLRQQKQELEMKSNNKIIRLKDPQTGYFTDEAKVCIMELVGEHEISAGRCGQVIETICRTVLNAKVPEDDLPSERSVLRFVDMGQFLGKMQVASALTNSEHFDLHTDATSRVGKKYVGQQVTTDDGQNLSCGYAVVASENADCLVNLSTDLLEELAVIYEDDASKQQAKFVEFLQKMGALMSDRAAVMKCFNERFNTMRRDLLQTDEDLDFLYCNAHVLLGFASAVVKTFKDTAAGAPVGRDSSSKFAGSSRGEHPVTRYVREACSCLGPRGDERFGCREHWLAYCVMSEHSSQITSFKANRFNNLFQASAALHFHQDDISTFFETCMSDLNWKQEGILLDSQSDIIDNHLVALGLMFFRLTGPYWCLLGKALHHLDFYRHVVEMKEFLERWAVNPEDAFAADFQGLFSVDMDLQNNDVFRSLITITDDRKEPVRGILRSLSAGFHDVVQLQLKDFLPEGRYHKVDDPELRQKLEHSRLTNLVGEQAFGDLDFSMFKRRNATAHHHSSVNILKRNKTLTEWFLTLSPEEQKAALLRAAAKHQQLRKQKRRAEQQALEMRRQILQENRAKKAARDEKRRQLKIKIIDSLKPHNGPCTNSQDVQRLLRTYKKKGEKRLALRAELQYHSVILGKKSPLLQVSKKIPELAKNLKQFLGGEPESDSEAAEDDADLEVEDTASYASSNKRRRTETLTESDASYAASQNSEEEEVEVPDLSSMSDILDLSFTFKVVNPGTLVAVGFEQGFYVGEVEQKLNSEVAVINFMSRCSAKDTVFKWPHSPDKCEVHEKFVIAANFDMTTTNGRFWTMSKEDAKLIAAKYRAYSHFFFH